MSYLLALSLGPVQDFIAAARRTQDLQAGSTLLVEIAKAAAGSVFEDGGELIFPSSRDAEGRKKTLAEIGDGPNKILAEIPDGKDPAEIAAKARKAAEKRLSDAWEEARGKLKPEQEADLRQSDPLAKKQIEGFLEFYAAWLPCTSDTYGTIRKELDRLLAGRKALRDFAPPLSEGGRAKSPLDPSRDCVLGKPGDLQTPKDCAGYPLWLKTRETLDAISLMKRVQGVTDPPTAETPSTSYMAAKAILPKIRRDAPDIIEYLESLVQKARDFAGPGVDIGDFLFPGRLDNVEIKQHFGQAMPEASHTPQQGRPSLKQHLGDVAYLDLLYARLREMKVPESPYYAILVADGDKMGALLGQKSLEKPASHRALSAALADFAGEAQGIVKAHDGHPVYTGGDDVLALLPVNQALKCAAALAQDFERRMAEFKQEPGIEGGTLSAGIAIVHHMDPLRVSLDRARAAEHAAKEKRDDEEGRDSLAVALHTRGGEPLTVAHKWDRYDWEQWIGAFVRGESKGLARGFPYELRTLAREFTGLPDEARGRLSVEADRVLKRKEGGKKLMLPSEATATPETLEAFAKKLVIARFLADYEFPEATHD